MRHSHSFGEPSGDRPGRSSRDEAHDFEHLHHHRHAHHHAHRQGHRHDMMAGRRGGPFGRGGRGGMDFPGDERDGPRGGGRMGRMFGQGDLKLLLLALIETQPRHGYELIRAIEELCGGTYSPSPGAIYPTLTFLEEAGYASVQLADAGGRKQYAITSEGREHLVQNRAEADALIQRLKLSARMMAKLGVPDEIREAMHQVRHVLMGHPHAWDKAEVRRVIAIIKQAAIDIAER